VYGQDADIEEVEQSNHNEVYYGHLTLEGSSLLLKGNVLSPSDARSLLGFDRYETFTSASHQAAVGGTFLVFGTILATAGIFCVSAQEKEPHILGYGMLIVADVFLPIGFVFNGVGKGRMNWVVNDYNRHGSQLSQSISVSASPSLVCVPTATGKSYGIGAGLQLHF
jgi:hypothetical protein